MFCETSIINSWKEKNNLKFLCCSVLCEHPPFGWTELYILRTWSSNIEEEKLLLSGILDVRMYGLCSLIHFPAWSSSELCGVCGDLLGLGSYRLCCPVRRAVGCYACGAKTTSSLCWVACRHFGEGGGEIVSRPSWRGYPQGGFCGQASL